MKYIFAWGLALSLSLSGCASFPPSSTKEIAPPVTESTSHTIAPPSEELFHDAAKAYGKGNHTESLELIHKALSEDEKNYKALSLKGVIVAFDISPDEGVTYINRAISLAPDYTQAHYDMALAQKLGKHYEESIFHFEKVLEKDPQNTWSYYGIATNYADLHNREKALLYIEKALHYGGEEVRQAAQTQAHFDWLRKDDAFIQLMTTP